MDYLGIRITRRGRIPCEMRSVHCARSPYTVRAYARGLAHFVGWVHEAGVELDAVTRPVIGQYIGAFGRESIGRASRSRNARDTPLVERPPVNEGRQARTVNHRLS